MSEQDIDASGTLIRPGHWLGRLFFVFLLVTIGSFLLLADQVLTVMLGPLEAASGLKLVFVDVQKLFLIQLEVSFFIAVFLIVPFVWSQLGQIKMEHLDQKYGFSSVGAFCISFVLLTVGAAFAYFLLIPPLAVSYAKEIDAIELGRTASVFGDASAEYLTFGMIAVLVSGLFCQAVLLLLRRRTKNRPDAQSKTTDPVDAGSLSRGIRE